MLIFAPDSALFLAVLSERGRVPSIGHPALPPAGSAGMGLVLVIGAGPPGGSYIHMIRDGWAAPSSAHLAVALELDGLALTRLRFQGTDDPTMLEGELAAGQAASLIEGLSCGRQLTVRYLAGTDGPWAIPIQGTYQILQASFQSSKERLGGAQEKRAVLSHGP
jgi:hypothetical protein